VLTGYDELYRYDALYRLTDQKRDTLNGTQTAITSDTFQQQWGPATGTTLNRTTTATAPFPFKKMFGSLETLIALIGLLNAILELPRSVTDVTILNPVTYQKFETATRGVLDVKAKDSAGRIFHIEMQISIHPPLLERSVFYASEVSTDQLSEGDDLYGIEYDDFDLAADGESLPRFGSGTSSISDEACRKWPKTG